MAPSHCSPPSPALQISGFLPWTLVLFSEPFCDLTRSVESNTQGAVHCPYLNHLEIHAAFEMFRFLCLPVLERTPSSPHPHPQCLHILACPSQSLTSYSSHSLLPSGAPSGNLHRLTFLPPDPLSHPSSLATQTCTIGGKNWPLNAPLPHLLYEGLDVDVGSREGLLGKAVPTTSQLPPDLVKCTPGHRYRHRPASGTGSTKPSPSCQTAKGFSFLSSQNHSSPFLALVIGTETTIP